MPGMPPPPPDSGPRPGRRWRRWALGSALAAVVVGTPAWVLREWWLGPLIARSLVQALDRQVGGRWQVERVGGSLIGGVRVEGLTCLEAPPDGLIRQCRIAQVAVDYRLLSLLGDEPLLALRAVTLNGVEMELDATAGGSGAESGPIAIPALPWAARLAIDGRIAMATAAGTVRLDELRVEGPLDGLRLAAAVHFAERPVGPLTLDVRHAGLVAESGWRVTGGLGTELGVEAALGFAPLAVHGTLGLGTGSRLTCELTAQGWDVSASVDAAHLAPPLRTVASVLGAPLPDTGWAQARGTVRPDGSLVLAHGDAAYQGLAISISDAHWDAERGLSAVGDLQAWAWPAGLGPGFAGIFPAAGVLEVQAHASEGRLAFDLVGRDLGATLTASGTVSGAVASAAWTEAEFDVSADLAMGPWQAAQVQAEGVQARLTLAGTWTASAGALHLRIPHLAGRGWRGDDLAADVETALWRGPDHALIDGDWRLTGTGSRAGGAPAALPIAAGGRLHADEAGTRLTADLAAPVAAQAVIASTARCTADGAWVEALGATPLRARAELPDTDVDVLAGLLPAGLHLDGHLSGSGEIPDLRQPSRWSADAALRGANLGGLPPLPPLLDINAALHADQDSITVTSLGARAGGGLLEVAGSLPLPGRPGPLALAVTGRDALLFQRPDVRLRADADLQVGGTWAEPALAGRIHVSDLVATTPVSWFGGRDLPALESPLDGLGALPPPWNRARLDLRLTGGDDARRSLEIRNNVLVATLAMDVTVTGRADLPVPAGEIRFSAGRLSLPFSSYRIDSAALRFQAGDPYDPVVEATASSQMQGYQLTTQVSGTLRHPRIEVTSIPPLDPEDALVLASTGRLPEELKRDGAAKSTIGAALPFFGRELQRWIMGDSYADDGENVFDRLAVLYDEERSERGLSTVRLEYLLKGPWYLVGERDAYEAYNLGLMWRWIFDDPARRKPELAAGGEPISGPPADWRVVRAPGVAALPVSTGALLATVPARQRHGSGANEPATLASAAQRMTDRLAEAGYPDAQVQPLPTIVDGTGHVRFEVAPGEPWEVATSRMTGAPPGLEAKLVAIIALGLPPGIAPTPTRVSATRGALRSALITAGHALAHVRIDVQREAPGLPAARVVATVRPGMHYALAVAAPEIADAVPEQLAGRLAEICRAADGRDWTRRQVVELRSQLLREMRLAGYAFARVETDAAEPALLSRPICRVRIAPGLPATLGAITLRGFDRTSERYVRRRLALEPGAPLRDGEPDAAVSRLRSSGVVRRLTAQVTPAGAPGDSQPAELALVAEEMPPRSIELGLGYGSYEGVRGDALYRDINLFGWGRTWEVGGDLSQRSYGGHTRLIDQDLLGVQRVLSVTLGGGWRQEPSFDRTWYSGEAAVRAPLTSWLDLRTAYTLEAEQATDRAASVVGSEQEGFVLNGSLESKLIWDGRDDRLLPTRGGIAELGLGVSDPVLGSQVSYLEWSSRLGWVLPLVEDRLAVAAQVAGTVRRTTDGAETLPIQYRMFLGGSTTVRSFGLDQLSPVTATGDALGGLTTAFANLELRTRIAGDLHAAAFYDVGKVSERSWSLDGALGHAIGGGLRYHLPIGPLRVDGAYNPGERWAADRSYAIEAALGFTF